ncbi:MAG: hypothetical protein ACYTHN_21580 [Planctomycetota bacterium]|jgi:hypothetical protein
MKPIMVYFQKPKDLLNFGNKARKDPEVEACKGLDEELWKRWIITELAKEFVCIRVNTRKADPSLLRRHRVARAPVISIFDFNAKQLYFSASARMRYQVLAKKMDAQRKRVEAEVKKIAESTEESPLVLRAKSRAMVLEQRECYDDGLAQLEKKRWAKAEELFQKGIAIERESEWKKKCKNGLIEIKAGKAYYEADALYGKRRFKECKALCEKVVSQYKEAKYFSAMAKELLEKVKKKVK